MKETMQKTIKLQFIKSNTFLLSIKQFRAVSFRINNFIIPAEDLLLNKLGAKRFIFPLKLDYPELDKK